MECRFGHDPERIGLNLARCRGVFTWRLHPALGIQAVCRRPEGLADDRADLGCEAAVDDEHAVFVLIDGQRSAPLLLLRLAVLDVAIDAPPGPCHLLDV